jgi:hypothetical protein
MDIGPLIYPGKYLNGYLQSSKYFNNVKNEIKELFKDEELTNEIKNKYKFLCDNSERVIVIHARRTDYIKCKDYHGPLEGIYYKNALGIILPKVHEPIIVLSSDDNDFWDEIKNDTGFKQKYNYVEWDMLDFLNKSEEFLRITSIYSITSPVLSLLTPLIILIIPFCIIKMKGIQLNFKEYVDILQVIISNQPIGKLFTQFNSVKIEQKIYILISASFSSCSLNPEVKLNLIKTYSGFVWKVLNVSSFTSFICFLLI